MQKRYIVQFFNKRATVPSEIEEVEFYATTLLDLYNQIDEWKSDGEFAPVYSDEITGIVEADW